MAIRVSFEAGAVAVGAIVESYLMYWLIESTKADRKLNNEQQSETKVKSQNPLKKEEKEKETQKTKRQKKKQQKKKSQRPMKERPIM